MTDRHSLFRTAIGGTGLALLLLARAGSATAAPMPVERFAAAATTQHFASALPLDTVLACFTARAAAPSFAHLARRPGAASLALRFDNLVFETLDFAALPGGGTAVTVRLSADYDARERARFTVARGVPLAACLAAPRQAIAAADPESAS